MGYPGIGKSCLASKENKYIDLDSSLFSIDDKKNKDWYKIYCKVAVDLSRQNFNVFVSCHKDVQEELIRLNELVFVVYPALHLKEYWIEKLENRYNESNKSADWRAYKRAKDHFEEDINSLSHEKRFHQIPIQHITYLLKSILNRELTDERVAQIKAIKCEQFYFEEKGEKFLDKKYHHKWRNLLFNNYPMFNKDELSAAIAVAYNLNHGGSFESAEEILTKRRLDKNSRQMLSILVNEICDKGHDFSKYLTDKGELQ